jgi:hypothetical protein
MDAIVRNNLTVYVDYPKIRSVRGHQRLTSHLMGDNIDELHKFAAEHGAKFWRFDKNKHHSHYDLWGKPLESVLRVLAPVSSKEMLRRINEKKTKY